MRTPSRVTTHRRMSATLTDIWMMFYMMTATASTRYAASMATTVRSSRTNHDVSIPTSDYGKETKLARCQRQGSQGQGGDI